MPMPDDFFRVLSHKEEMTFRRWTRDNWSIIKPENFDMFHPVVRDEWLKLDKSNP